MATETDIFNQALDVAGARYAVATVDEDSREAAVCRRWYETSRDMVLRAAPWPLARAVRRLGVLEERDVDADWTAPDPAPGWRYAYSFPDDMIHPRNLTTFERFELGSYNDQLAIMSQVENAILVYTRRETVVARWDVSMRLAVIHALGAFITLPLTGKPGRSQVNVGKANDFIIQARVDAANMEENTYQSMPDWLTARGASLTTTPDRYVYPYGQLITVEAVGVS